MFGLAEAEAHYPGDKGEDSWVLVYISVFYLSCKIGGLFVEWVWWL